MAPRVPRFQNDNMLSSPSPDFHSQDIGRESLRKKSFSLNIFPRILIL